MYLQLFGDPIPGQNGLPGKDVVNLSMALSPEIIADYKNRFKVLPRQVFDAMMAKVLSGYESNGDYGLASTQLKTAIATDEKKTVYALLLDLFNEVNQAAMITQGISDPWVWEAEKMRILYETQASGELAASNPDLFLQSGQGTDYAKIITRSALESRAVKVAAKIPDKAYSIQFLISTKLLLDREEFQTVDLVLGTYETLSTEAWNVLQTYFHE